MFEKMRTLNPAKSVMHQNNGNRIPFFINNFYSLSFSPKGVKEYKLLPPWGKVGKGVISNKNDEILKYYRNFELLHYHQVDFRGFRG
jgi:hypothetical protein